MNDLIHLDQISSGCDCNKPKQSCGCKTTQSCGCSGSQQGHQTVDLSNQYFKVPNLFGELKSEWQRAEARSNLGITDILNFEQTVISDYSEGPNVWTMTASKGGNKILYNFVVKNGAKGESATIEIVDIQSLSPGSKPVCTQVGTENHAKYILGIPAGQGGEKGEQGESAFAIANKIRRQQGLDPFETEEEWLASLRGAKGDDGVSLTKVQLIAYEKAATVSYPTAFGDRAITADIFIWRYTWSDGRYTDVWVPYGGGQQASSESKTVFLYKKHTFDANPDATTLSNYLSTLYSRVNIDDTTGKTEETLITTEGFVRYAPIIENSGRDFIYLASAVVTNGVTSRWSVVQLTGAQGSQGKPGDPGSPGTSGQGLTGPVIRLRGNWVEGECYVNQSAQPQNGNELRFIDIVYYIDAVNPSKTGYYQVRPTNDTCVYARPTDTNKWIKSNDFDFLFVDTLVANYLSAHYVDADEVRIHDRGTGTDKIVAGMTSGKAIGNEENDAGDVRIWAGTTVDILDQGQKDQNGKWHLNIQNAPFRVTQNGHLYAEDADIKGTVQADILRLGSGSFESGTNTNNSRVLPKLENNKIQMFYLLTDEMTSGTFTLSPSLGDKIQYLDIASGNIVQSSNGVPLKPKKLYQIFGIDHDLNSSNTTHQLIWHLVEQNLASIEVTATSTDGGIVPQSCYTVSYFMIIQDIVDNTVTGTNVGTLKPKGTIYLNVTNNYTSPITLHIAVLPMHIQYNEENNYDMTIMQKAPIVVQNQPLEVTFNYEHQTQNANQYLEINLENLESSAPETSLVNNAPTITMLTGSDNFINEDSSYQEVGKHKFTFNNLISATY